MHWPTPSTTNDTIIESVKWEIDILFFDPGPLIFPDAWATNLDGNI